MQAGYRKIILGYQHFAHRYILSFFITKMYIRLQYRQKDCVHLISLFLEVALYDLYFQKIATFVLCL